MALSFDDKLLGEKVNNYCSSSEDELEEENSDAEQSVSEIKCDEHIPVQLDNTHQVIYIYNIDFRPVLKGL